MMWSTGAGLWLASLCVAAALQPLPTASKRVRPAPGSTLSRYTAATPTLGVFPCDGATGLQTFDLNSGTQEVRTSDCRCLVAAGGVATVGA